MNCVGILRIDGFETMEQAAVQNIYKLVNTMISNWEINDLGGLGDVRIKELERPIGLRYNIVGQGHCHEWNAQSKGILGAREDDWVLEPE
jgi:hypothetical protein